MEDGVWNEKVWRELKSVKAVLLNRGGSIGEEDSNSPVLDALTRRIVVVARNF